MVITPKPSNKSISTHTITYAILPIHISCCCCCLVTKSLTVCDTMDCSPPGYLSTGFSRQEYWSGLPFNPPGHLLYQGRNLCLLYWQGDSLPLSHQGSPIHVSYKQLQFSSVAQPCLTLCDPMNHSTPGLLVYHQLPEFTQTHSHRVSDAIQPSHPVVPFSSCPQSLPASESFPMSQLFT